MYLEGNLELVTKNGYDVLGNVTSATMWRGATALTTATVYDNFNRPVQVTDSGAA